MNVEIESAEKPGLRENWNEESQALCFPGISMCVSFSCFSLSYFVFHFICAILTCLFLSYFILLLLLRCLLVF